MDENVVLSLKDNKKGEKKRRKRKRVIEAEK